MIDAKNFDPARPVLIYGPTASGKTALALEIARAQGRIIVNADALQIYRGWEVLTAQPSTEEQAAAPHHLYGFLDLEQPYSVGDWLRDIRLYLGQGPIIIGGTGLYFKALTKGLADIPPIAPDIRQEADQQTLEQMIADLDAATRAGIDLHNRARVQRAWEVQRATGRSIRDWQADTPPPLLKEGDAHCLCLRPQVEWLNDRIARRFDIMLDTGALNEARAIEPHWNPTAPSSKAIGAAELIAYLRGDIPLEEAKTRAVIASRQYAKRQRTWARANMKTWTQIDLPSTD